MHWVNKHKKHRKQWKDYDGTQRCKYLYENGWEDLTHVDLYLFVLYLQPMEERK